MDELYAADPYEQIADNLTMVTFLSVRLRSLAMQMGRNHIYRVKQRELMRELMREFMRETMKEPIQQSQSIKQTFIFILRCFFQGGIKFKFYTKQSHSI